MGIRNNKLELKLYKNMWGLATAPQKGKFTALNTYFWHKILKINKLNKQLNKFFKMPTKAIG